MDENKMNINWYPGHMAKTKKQIIEDLKLIDIVIELLDARIPISSQNPDLKQIIGNKKKIIVLNKSDLADENENNKWIQYFKKENISAILVNSNSGDGISNVLKKLDELYKEEKEKMMSKGRIGKSIRIMVVGIPNVGKSSFINRMSKKASAEVGNKPGITKQKQWIRISNGIELLDTPGVLWPKFEYDEIALNLSFTGTIKDEILEKTEIAFYLIKYLLEKEQIKLLERYKLSQKDLENAKQDSSNVNECVANIINIIARKRGAIMSGNAIDEEKIATIILEDFRSGRIGKISLEKVN